MANSPSSWRKNFKFNTKWWFLKNIPDWQIIINLVKCRNTKWRLFKMSNISKKVIKTSKLCHSINTLMVSNSKLFIVDLGVLKLIFINIIQTERCFISFGLTNPWMSTKTGERHHSIPLIIIIKGGGGTRDKFFLVRPWPITTIRIRI